MSESIPAPINPVVQEIPQGAIVTIILRNGQRHHGTDDTTDAQAEAGVLALYKLVGCGRKAMNQKTYLLASEVIGFEIEYD